MKTYSLQFKYHYCITTSLVFEYKSIFQL